MEEKNIGSDFDEFLKEEGIFEETQEVAVKRVLAYKNEEMKPGGPHFPEPYRP